MFSHSIRKKCPLCFQLSSGLKGFLRRLFGSDVDCQGISQRALGDKRVAEINSLAPDCVCEKHRMSEHSLGAVENSEMLARFVFSPIQIDKKGKLKPGAFSHVHEKGCSIQRDSVAGNDEILEFVKQFLDKRDDYVWKGLLLAECGHVRGILVENSKRAVCVYDTAKKANPAHGEMCQTHHIIDEADKIELRHDLLAAFGNETVIPPNQYRSSMVWNNLPQPLQARK